MPVSTGQHKTVAAVEFPVFRAERDSCAGVRAHLYARAFDYEARLSSSPNETDRFNTSLTDFGWIGNRGLALMHMA